MEPFLLTTKLRIPPQPHHVLPRAALVETLEQAILPHPLIQISAPAGYGKTTLLAQWAHSSRFRIAWLSISEDDNDFERFFRYLVTAWDEALPGVKDSPLGTLLGAMSPDYDAVLSTFVNVASDMPDHIVFVLDDYHLIEESSIHQALTFLVDHAPPTLHFVLAGRGEPALPLARYRARQQLLELRTEDLRFAAKETSDFLNEIMQLELLPSEVVRLQAQIEGWIAGLQLAALTLQRRGPGSDQMLLSGKHRFIADYLKADVLAPLADHTREFLLKTSILESLCSPLCDAVTGKETGQQTLEALERANLFLVPLDDRREWFRYHHLFADFLVAELKTRSPDDIRVVHRRAARWYLAQDLPEPAFRHAVEGDDPKLVVQIFDRYVTAKLNGGEFRVVKRWVDSIPADWYAAYPVLGLARVGFLAFTGAFETSMRRLDEVEQRLTPTASDTADWQQARVSAVRCMMACIQNDTNQAETYAFQALRDLPEDDLSWRPGIYAALGDTYRQNGRWDEAKECYLKALTVAESPQIGFMAVHVYGALADLVLRQGRLNEAISFWKKARAVIEEQGTWGRLPLPLIGWVFIRLAEMLYERDERKASREHLSRGQERAELGGDVRALIAGYLIAGRLELTEGNVAAAAEYLERARPLIDQAQFPDWTSRFQRLQLELWLAQDQLRAATRWADEMLARTGIEEQPESENAQLAIARVLMVKADAGSIDRAQKLLKRLIPAAQAQGRVRVQIEALALLGLCMWKRDQKADAMTQLERALRLAEPEEYIRLFADLGQPMARLLQEARSRAVMPEYVAKLLAAFGAVPSLASSGGAALTEPLTPREREILELLAAGLTNREIAERLVVSSETVKKHTSTIYGKLGVSNRTKAVARARDLDLLD